MIFNGKIISFLSQYLHTHINLYIIMQKTEKAVQFLQHHSSPFDNVFCFITPNFWFKAVLLLHSFMFSQTSKVARSFNFIQLTLWAHSVKLVIYLIFREEKSYTVTKCVCGTCHLNFHSRSHVFLKQLWNKTLPNSLGNIFIKTSPKVFHLA